MTQAQWLTCDDPDAMIAALRTRPSRRKQILFAVACWRRRADLREDRLAVVEAMEGFVEGLKTRAQWVAAARVHHARVEAESVFVPDPFSEDDVEWFAQRPDPDLTLPVEK